MPELGRWNVGDPLAERTKSWSTYVFSANNSVRYLDPDGRTWGDPKEQENLNNLIAKRIEKLQKANDAIQEQINQGGLSEKKLSKLTTELKENKTMIGFMQQSIKDIETIAKSSDVFYLTKPSQKDGTHSVFKTKGSDGKDRINIEGTETAINLHEIRHIGQSFEAGGMKFNKYGQLLNAAKIINNKPDTKAINDNEIQAYRVGYSYDKTSYPGTAYSLDDINEESLTELSSSNSSLYK